MENLQITKEKALATYASSDSKGKLFLEGLFGKNVFITDITEVIKTFADACIAEGTTEAEFGKKYGHLEEDEFAYMQLKLITKALNGGEVMEYDGSTYLYYPWFNSRGSRGGFSFCGYRYRDSISLVSSRLCSKNSKLATYSGKQFLSIWDSYLN